jgi:hypothetical protein
MQSKVCQDGEKALMSYSNKELGEWILRDILELREGELVTLSIFHLILTIAQFFTDFSNQ